MFTERREVIAESIPPLNLKVVRINILYGEMIPLHRETDEKHISLVNFLNQWKLH